MSAAAVSIERIGITLYGVSQQIAEAAVSGLEGELARRIAALHAEDFASADFARVALGPLTAPENIDPAALRALIAESLIAHMLDAAAAPAQPDSETPETRS